MSIQVKERSSRVGSLGQRVSRIVAARGILWLLVKRDLKVRYADSLLGYVWSVLDPLLMGMIYWFVFTQIFQRSVGQDPYIIFLLCGLLPWLWFTSGVSEGSKALRTQSKLVRSTSLPREIWVLRTVIAKGLEFAFSIPVLIIFMIFYPPEVNSALPVFLLGALIQLVLLTGVGLLLSPLVVLYRDLDPLIRIGLRFLFYASPVIYGISDLYVSNLPRVIEILYILNPMSGILSAYRAGFFSAELHWDAIGASAGVSLLILALGWVVFARMERAVLKEM
jgi:ABC-2 type transport system permease protein